MIDLALEILPIERTDDLTLFIISASAICWVPCELISLFAICIVVSVCNHCGNGTSSAWSEENLSHLVCLQRIRQILGTLDADCIAGKIQCCEGL